MTEHDPELVEAVARAISASKGINPDCFYQHNFEGDYPEDDKREYIDTFSGEHRVQLFHRAWRHSVKAAESALTAINLPARLAQARKEEREEITDAIASNWAAFSGTIDRAVGDAIRARKEASDGPA